MRKWTIGIWIILLFILFSGVNSCKKSEKGSVKPVKTKKETKTSKKKLTRAEIMKKFGIKSREDFKKLTPEQRQKFLEMMKALRESDTSGGGNLPLVKIHRIKRAPILNYLTFNTTLEPEKMVPIYSKVDGIIAKIVRDEGSFVKKGEILALIDDKDIRNSYEQAKLSVRQAEINLKDAEIKRDDEEANFKRSKRLYQEKIISEKDFSTAKLNYRSAQLSYERAKQQLDIEKEKFKALELQLSYTKIRSPIVGWVTSRKIDQGMRVNPGTELYTVEDFDPLLARVYVPEKDIIKLKVGMDVDVKSEVYDTVFRGKIKIINPRIDTQSGTFKVTITVKDKSLKLRPGMLVSCNVIISKKENALIVPKKAVFYKDGNPYVFVLRRGSVVKLRSVKLGTELEKEYEILEGLKEREIVVVQGIENLKDGVKVKVL